MRVIGFQAPGSPEVLREFDLAEPTIGPGQVKIEVRAATVNPSDVVTRSGLMHDRYAGVAPPYVPGWDAAGVVVDADPATDWKPGDEVIAITLPVHDGGGAYAEHIVVNADSVAAKPAGLSFAEAATIPMNGLTAMQVIVCAAVNPGATLAVTGAAGAVGGYVVQLATAGGIVVVADAAARDAELVKGLGARYVVARGDAMTAAVVELFPNGVDAIADTALLGDGVLAAVRDNGHYVGLRPPQAGGAVNAVRGIQAHYPMVATEVTAQTKLAELARLAEAGKLTTRVADIVPAVDAAAAHRRLERGGVRGRIVLAF